MTPTPIDLPAATQAHSASRHTAAIAGALGLLAVCTALLSAGCHAHSAGGVSVVSRDDLSVFAPKFTTAVYLPVDPNTADLYLSDIPASRLADANDKLADARGSILHIHLFLYPLAGETPIDATACNVTIRHFLLAGPGSLGMYGGGGFVLPDGNIGDDRIAGSIEKATHRLLRSTDTFHDLLGPGNLSGRFSAPRNDALCRSIASHIDPLFAMLPPASAKEADLEMDNTLRMKAKPDAPGTPEPPPVDAKPPAEAPKSGKPSSPK